MRYEIVFCSKYIQLIICINYSPIYLCASAFNKNKYSSINYNISITFHEEKNCVYNIYTYIEISNII